MVKFLMLQIKLKEITIEQVPLKYREEVEKLLKK